MGIKSKPGANADTWRSVGIVGCCKEDVRHKIPEEFSWTPCSMGNGVSLCSPISCFFFNPFFLDKITLIQVVWGGTSSLPKKKKHFEVESRLGIPRDGSLDSSSARAVFSCCAAHWKLEGKAAKLTQKPVGKGTSCTRFLSPHPDQSSVSKIPPVEGGNRGNNVSSSPNLKLFTPFWCPVPFQWRQSWESWGAWPRWGFGVSVLGLWEMVYFWNIFAYILNNFTSFSVQKDKNKVKIKYKSQTF